MHYTTLVCSVGVLKMIADEQNIYQITFSTDKQASHCELAPATHPLLSRAKAQLGAYFAQQRQHLELPLAPQGTAFQQAVWAIIRTIPYGETRSYGCIAAELGDPNKARAVGQAAGRNPLPIVIPCHRVIGSSGQLTGFSSGLNIKQYLLALEKPQADQSVIPLSSS